MANFSEIQDRGIMDLYYIIKDIFSYNYRYVDDIYLYNIEADEEEEHMDPETRVHDVILLKNERFLLTMANDLSVVNFKDLSPVYVKRMENVGLMGVVSKDEKTLFLAMETGQIQLYNVEDGSLKDQFQAHESKRSRYSHDEECVRDIQMAASGNFFVTASGRDNLAKLWDAKTCTMIHQFKGHQNGLHSAKITSDEKFLLTAADNEVNIRMWSLKSGVFLGSFFTYSQINTIDMIPDGNRVMLTTAHDELFLLSVNTISENFKGVHAGKAALPEAGGGNSGKQPPDAGKMRKQAGKPAFKKAPPPTQPEVGNQSKPAAQSQPDSPGSPRRAPRSKGCIIL